MDGEESSGTDVKEVMAASIQSILLNVPQEDAKNIAAQLFHKGLNSTSRMSLVQEQDFHGFLDTFDARQVIQAWREKGAQTRQQRPQISGNIREQQGSSHEWEFSIDWKDIYNADSKIQSRLSQGKKLKRRTKAEMVKRLVNQVRQRVPHAQRSIFVQVAKELKTKYTQSFRSELANGKISRGSLTFRMQTKFDNDNRAKRKTLTEKEAPNIKSAYGCRKWRVSSLPQGESDETIEEKRIALAQHYEQRRDTAWDWEFIEMGMTITYGAQRKDINKQEQDIKRAQKQSSKKGNCHKRTEEETVDDPSPEVPLSMDIRDRWPFLFTPRGMLHHFHMLTEVDLTEKFEEFLSLPCERVKTFLLETNKPDTRRIKKKLKRAGQKEDQDPKVVNLGGMLLLLLQRFHEKEEALWKMVDEHAREEDIPKLVELPKTPCLVIPGKSIFTTQTFYFTIDGTLLGTARGFIEAIQMLFASFYVFNLEYTATAQICLEFIQRIVAGINPPRGNKRPPKSAGGTSSKRVYHHKLSLFDEKYNEFFADKDDDSDSSDEA